jgi:hypothetical protein
MRAGVPPRNVERYIKPGYTSSGDKIVCIQTLGEHRARFVVQDSEGKRSLVDRGKLAIQGAKYAGISRTNTADTDISNLRNLVGGGGTYGLTYVAPGEWDLEKRTSKNKMKLPFIMVGFFYQGLSQRTEAHLSRSNLGKVLSSSAAAESLVVAGLGEILIIHWKIHLLASCLSNRGKLPNICNLSPGSESPKIGHAR